MAVPDPRRDGRHERQEDGVHHRRHQPVRRGGRPTRGRSPGADRPAARRPGAQAQRRAAPPAALPALLRVGALCRPLTHLLTHLLAAPPTHQPALLAPPPGSQPRHHRPRAHAPRPPRPADLHPAAGWVGALVAACGGLRGWRHCACCAPPGACLGVAGGGRACPQPTSQPLQPGHARRAGASPACLQPAHPLCLPCPATRPTPCRRGLPQVHSRPASPAERAHSPTPALSCSPPPADEGSRKSIFKSALRKSPVAPDVDLDLLSKVGG